MPFAATRLLAFLFLLSASLPAAAADDPAKAQLEVQRFVLPNGLTLLVHEDHRAPLASLALIYRVGSKDEVNRKTGLAHLFEHLMFTGSENGRSKHQIALQELGAVNINGTTSHDLTSYFETVPTGSLERLLWLESDRARNLIGQLDKTRLDEQRGVVKNEKRQRESPAGPARQIRINSFIYPYGHPYQHTISGSYEDLDGITLDDAKAFFRAHYGAANTILSISGDVQPDAVRTMVDKWFGDLAPGQSYAHRAEQTPVMAARVVEQLVENGASHLFIRAWPVAGVRDPDSLYLSLLPSVLADGEDSRLRKALVRDRQFATSVGASVGRQLLAGAMQLQIDLKPEADIAAVEAELDRQLADLLENGPSSAELQRAKKRYAAGSIRSLESTLSQALAMGQNEALAGDPNFTARNLQRIAAATREDVRRAAQKYLRGGYYQAHTTPTIVAPASAAIDRSKPPAFQPTAAAAFPQPVRWTLSNGIAVILAERHSWPTVEMNVLFDGGSIHDGSRQGLAQMAMGLLGRGTAKRSALEIEDALRDNGMTISAGAGPEQLTLHASMLVANLEPSLDLAADLLRAPSFPEDAFNQSRKARLTAIGNQGQAPAGAISLAYGPALYGSDHPYGISSLIGTRASIEALTRDDLVAFATDWLRPDRATILVAGDITRERADALLEERFGRWSKPATPPPAIAPVPPRDLPASARVILIDVPKQAQATIYAAQLIDPDDKTGDTERSMFNTLVGGFFGSRLNLNLRESKGWSYGVSSGFTTVRHQRSWSARAAVDRAHAGDAIVELQRELRELVTTRPFTDAEIESRRNFSLAALATQYETNGALLSQLTTDRLLGHPIDDPLHVEERVRALDTTSVNRAAHDLLRPDRLTWIIAGDLETIRPQIERLNLGPIELWSRDGARLPAAAPAGLAASPSATESENESK